MKKQDLKNIGVCLIVVSLFGGFLGYKFLTARSRIESEVEDIYFSLKQTSTEKQDLDDAKRKELIDKLFSKEPDERWMAASELARWKDEKSVKAIIEAMQDTEGTIRTCVMAESLGKIGDRRAIPALIQAIKHPVNQDLRMCATKALGEIKDNRALRPLIEKFRNSKNDFFTIEAIGKLGDKRALPMLNEAAKNPTTLFTRATIERAILMIKIQNDNDPISALIEALESEDRQINSWALKSLALKQEREAIASITSILQTSNSKELKVYAAAALAYYGKEARLFLERAKLTGDKITLWAAERAIRLLENS